MGVTQEVLDTLDQLDAQANEVTRLRGEADAAAELATAAQQKVDAAQQQVAAAQQQQANLFRLLLETLQRQYGPPALGLAVRGGGQAVRRG